jgi:hypothetical protein
MEFKHDRLVIEQEPIHVLFLSEPYPVLLRTGYVVAADVSLRIASRKVERSLIISSYSIANGLRQRINENNNVLSGVQIWLYKSGPEKTASYIVED